MSIRTDEFDVDSFARAIPGQSLTDTPAKNPYEKPAMVSSPQQAYDLVTQSLENQDAILTFSNLLDAGISAETLASSIVLKMFSEGVFTPDVAEIIKPAVVGYLVEKADELGIEGIQVLNEAPAKQIEYGDALNLMQKINPDKFQKTMNEFGEEAANEQLAELIDFEDQEELEEQRNSFLDMEVKKDG